MVKKHFSSFLILALFATLFSFNLVIAQESPAWETYQAKTTWSFDFKSDESDCDEGITTGTEQVTIEYDRSKVNFDFTKLDLAVLHGSVKDYQWNITGDSYEEDGGTTTITRTDLTLSPDCSSVVGEIDWTWGEGSRIVCKGTDELNGKRTDGTGCPMPSAITVKKPAEVPKPNFSEIVPPKVLAPEKEKSKSNWVLYASLTAIILAVAIGYYFLKMKKRKKR